MRELKGARYLTRLSLLVAVCVAISVLEGMIPPIIPVPGVKIGLSNIVILWTMFSYRSSSAFFVLVARILICSIFAGQMTGFLYSLSGGLLCFGVMCILKKLLGTKYIVLTSIFGAVFHNIGQLLAATVVINQAVWYYLPYLMISAVVSGLFTGLCARFLKKYI